MYRKVGKIFPEGKLRGLSSRFYTFIYLCAILSISRISLPIFGCSKYKSITDVWIWKLGTRPLTACSLITGNTKFESSLQCTPAARNLCRMGGETFTVFLTYRSIGSHNCLHSSHLKYWGSQASIPFKGRICTLCTFFTTDSSAAP